MTFTNYLLISTWLRDDRTELHWQEGNRVMKVESAVAKWVTCTYRQSGFIPRECLKYFQGLAWIAFCPHPPERLVSPYIYFWPKLVEAGWWIVTISLVLEARAQEDTNHAERARENIQVPECKVKWRDLQRCHLESVPVSVWWKKKSLSVLRQQGINAGVSHPHPPPSSSVPRAQSKHQGTENSAKWKRVTFDLNTSIMDAISG